ncbi:HAD-IA family hydrolase [Candidatus Woesebacteria bacterium]|nr:HAD-IA family hydrolase [Candidatus Woesebacteria bacterium]
MIKKLKELVVTKQHLVFDFDLTIAKMNIDWSQWHEGVEKIYTKIDPNIVYDGLAKQDPHHFYNLMAEKHGTELVEIMKDFNQKYEDEHLLGFTPYQDLIDFIVSAKTKNRYVYSSNSRKTVEKGLTSLGIINEFDQIISRDDVSLVKPSPEGFYTLPKFLENKNQFLMIGDSNSDQEAAKTAGVDFIRCEYFFTQ